MTTPLGYTPGQSAAAGTTDVEVVRDTIAAALVQGTRITITVDDPSNTITIATTATTNSSDATLLARGNHTGTQLSSTVSDFVEAVQDVVGTLLVQGVGVDFAYDDTGNTLTLSSTKVTANNQTGTNYTLVLADAGKVIELNNASAIALTVPANSTVAYPVGTVIELWQQGAGQVTVGGAGGVTIRSAGAKLKLTQQYSGAALRKVATDEWALVGDLTT